ncbi:MAG: helix-turn-helix transcriptional regulator [Patescibacteria group bacterium]
MAISQTRAAEVEFDTAIRTVEIAKLFGENLRAVRSVRKLSMSELGHQVGLTGSHLSRVEGGRVPISYYSASKICEVLNVKLSSMLDRDYNYMFADLIEVQDPAK